MQRKNSKILLLLLLLRQVSIVRQVTLLEKEGKVQK